MWMLSHTATQTMLAVVYPLSVAFDTFSAIVYNSLCLEAVSDNITHIRKTSFRWIFFLCVWILSFTTVYLYQFKFHYPFKTAQPQKLSFIEKVKLNSYTMFSKQKGFASHNCLAFGKQREEKKHLQEKDRQTGQVCEALESRYTRWPPRCNMATTTNSEKILSLYNVQNFFLMTFLFSYLSIQTFFCEKN